MGNWLFDLPQLLQTHFHGGSAVHWSLTNRGISINEESPQGTPGAPVSASRVWSWFGDAIRAAAESQGVPVELLVAIVLTESAGGQSDLAKVTGAIRHEPGYISDDRTPNKVSAGCCQTLLSTARELLHKPDLETMDLEDPAASLQAAAAYVAKQAGATLHDPPLVAAGYNAGGLYHDRSPRNRWRLRCYPIGSSAYIDRFVLWFNDAMHIGNAHPEFASGAPSFAQAIVNT